MSIKNQKTLFISALVLIALTIVGLVALNYTVEKISEIKSPPIVMTKPPPSAPRFGIDDPVDKKNKPPDMPFNGMGMPQGFPHQGPPGNLRPEGKERHPQDPIRRVRNGKAAPDLKRAKVPGSKDETTDRAQRPSPPYPQNGRDQYFTPPMPDGRNLDPAEREMMEKELERRREMFYGSPNGPPPGYYPPPGFEGPNNGYDGPEDYFDYDYDQDIEGKWEDGRANNKKAALTRAYERDTNDYYDELDYDLLEDEYINDYED